jgi:Flp pilus assembly pilin Flp
MYFMGAIMVKMLNLFVRDESGAVSVEYGFAILFAAGIATTILTLVRDEVSSAFTLISNRLESRANSIS